MIDTPFCMLSQLGKLFRPSYPFSLYKTSFAFSSFSFSVLFCYYRQNHPACSVLTMNLECKITHYIPDFPRIIFSQIVYITVISIVYPWCLRTVKVAQDLTILYQSSLLAADIVFVHSARRQNNI